ncbi:histidine kinase [Sutterella sp.]|uniref:histidine kinase n=1 Tax=Sutterella sp. TaxID=1981025 RepID=UPI0026E01C61|nr:histidine kinase [Sutterella sp.]MDO5530488.1 histidine kinase [Sutterella sp.]
MALSSSPRVRSLYREFRLAFILISACVCIVAVPAVVLTELSTGSGGAINVSGSLRMQSFKLTVAVTNPYATREEHDRATREAVEEFWTRLTSPALTTSISTAATSPVRVSYNLVSQRFTEEIRPLALESIGSEGARRRFMALVPGFVEDVDDFVFLLENTLSRRMFLLKGLLLFTGLGAAAVTVVMLRVMRRRIFEPVEELERAAYTVRGGDFSVRVEAAKQNSEIGRFARGFNFMVNELERLYGSLEAEVAKKTLDLNRRNQGLEFLAEASDKVLVDGPELPAAVTTVLEGAVKLGCARSAEFLVSADPQKPFDAADAYRFAATGEAEPSEKAAETVEFITQGMREEAIGLLRVRFDEAPLPWQRYFLGMTAALIGRAVATSLRAMDDRRLAVFEERSTIARELHDSIAQSLSFSKIQLLRLRKAIEADPAGPQVQEVIGELNEGISTAYRQLREVLTAFRLRIQGNGFAGAVNDAVETMRNRTGLPISLKNTLIGVELSPNEQVHFLQILREALANIEKHARATEAAVRIERTASGGIMLSVTDNGVGIPVSAEKDRHFGLGIMRERADALGAELTITRRPEGGTLVRVEKKTSPESGKAPQ